MVPQLPDTYMSMSFALVIKIRFIVRFLSRDIRSFFALHAVGIISFMCDFIFIGSDCWSFAFPCWLFVRALLLFALGTRRHFYI